MEFNDLKKNLKKNFDGLKKISVAILGDSATQFLHQAVRGMGYEAGYNLEIFEADYNQVERQIMDHSSELYEFDPAITILFESSHKLLHKFNEVPAASRADFARYQIERISALADALSQKSATKIIYLNFAEMDDAVFGNYGNKVPGSFIYQLRKLNYLLMELASRVPNLFVCDLSGIQNRFGRGEVFSPSIYVNSDMVLSVGILPEVAKSIVGIIGAIQGKVAKCLVLDLDNTLWGGVIGDDGLENIQIGSLGIGKAFSEFQWWIKSLQQRGIILAVCSKNDAPVAKEPFQKHPEMVLRLDDIAVFVANWENKADNIRDIQATLNIGFDSMVFLDDNPFERNIVRENVPQVIVPEMPEDPAEYVQFLSGLNLFETASFSEEDTARTQQYQVEAKRMAVREHFTNEADFLKSLHMLSDVRAFDPFSTPRVAQLSQRSNQFNLRTVRYAEDDIKRIASDDRYVTFSFTLEDKFGDHGLICVVILQKESDAVLFIDTWLMSCRVLKRGMEHFTLNTLVEVAHTLGCNTLKGEYVPTAKNSMVENHYRDLGFVENQGYWWLDVAHYSPKSCFIHKKTLEYHG
jgi:FkbH-like protein